MHRNPAILLGHLIDGKTFEQLGKEHDLSPQRVHQIYSSTLRHIGFSKHSRMTIEQLVEIRFRLRGMYTSDPARFDESTPEGFYYLDTRLHPA